MDFDQHVTASYSQYSNITVNIWLMKGQHHFVQCNEHLGYKYALSEDPNNPFLNFATDPDLEAINTLCKSDATFFPLRRSSAEEMLDDN